MNQAQKALSRIATWTQLPLLGLGLLALSVPAQALDLGRTSTRAEYVVPRDFGDSPYLT